MGLDDGCRCALADFDDIVGGDGARIAVGGDHHELDGRIDVAMRLDPEITPASRKAPVHDNNGLIRVEGRSCRRGEFDIARSGQRRMLGVELAIGEDKSGAGEARERGSLEQARDIFRTRFDRKSRRIGAIDEHAQIRPAPILHPRMGQEDAAIGKLGRCLGNRYIHAASLANPT